MRRGSLLLNVYGLTIFVWSLFIGVASANVDFARMSLCAGDCDVPAVGDYVFQPSEIGYDCIVQSTAATGQAKVFNIICNDSIPSYEDAGVVKQNITGIPVGTENDEAKAAFNAYAGSTPPCAAGFIKGAGGEGYIFSSVPSTNPVQANISLTMWKRTSCSTTAGADITPIGNIGGGSGSGGGGTATDMGPTNTLITQSNTLLTDINTKLSAPSGGGSSTDMTATNDLLTGIGNGINSTGGTNELLTGIQSSLSPGLDNGDISAPDTSGIGAGLDASLSGVGVNPSGPGGLHEQLDASLEFQGKAGKSSFQEIFETHRTAWMASSSSNSLFTWINSLNANFASGLPSFNFNLAWSKVNRNIDLNDYSILFDMFRICVLFTATIISYRIVFKG